MFEKDDCWDILFPTGEGDATRTISTDPPIFGEGRINSFPLAICALGLLLWITFPTATILSLSLIRRKASCNKKIKCNTILILRQSSSQSSPGLPGGRVGFHLARKTRRLGGVHLRGCPEATAAEASSPRLLRLSERRRLWLCSKRALALTPKPSGGLSKACWLPEGRTSKSAWRTSKSVWASSVTLALGNRTKAGLASSAKGSEWALALPESSCRLTKLSNAR